MTAAAKGRLSGAQRGSILRAAGRLPGLIEAIEVAAARWAEDEPVSIEDEREDLERLGRRLRMLHEALLELPRGTRGRSVRSALEVDWLWRHRGDPSSLGDWEVELQALRDRVDVLLGFWRGRAGRKAGVRWYRLADAVADALDERGAPAAALEPTLAVVCEALAAGAPDRPPVLPSLVKSARAYLPSLRAQRRHRAAVRKYRESR